MEDLMNDMVNSLNSLDDYELHDNVYTDLMVIMSDYNLLDRAMKMDASINSQGMADLMLEVVIGDEFSDIVRFLTSGNDQLQLTIDNDRPQQSWGIPGLSGWAGGKGGKRKRVAKKGGGGAFELLVVKILIKIFFEIPPFLEKWGEGMLDTKGQALWMHQVKKSEDKAVLRMLRQMFKPYFVGDRVYAGTASELRKMLRVQYPTVITRIMVAKDEFPEYANDTTYSRRNVQYMDEKNKILKYTHGDVLFDGLLKIGVAKTLSDKFERAPEMKESFLNALSTKFKWKRRRSNSSNAANNSSTNNSQKIQAYPASNNSNSRNARNVNNVNNGRSTYSRNVNNVDKVDAAYYYSNTNNTRTDSDQNKKIPVVGGGKRKSKK
jgi:hypothetical protein